MSVDLKHRPEPYQFKFDCVLPEGTSQQEIFDRKLVTDIPRQHANTVVAADCDTIDEQQQPSADQNQTSVTD